MKNIEASKEMEQTEKTYMYQKIVLFMEVK